MDKLTDKQAAVLAFVREYLAASGYPPTHQEIMAKFGFNSTNGARDHLQALVRKGYITMEPRRARAIKIVRKSDD